MNLGSIKLLVNAAHCHSMVICGEPLDGLSPEAEDDEISEFVEADPEGAVTAVTEYLKTTI